MPSRENWAKPISKHNLKTTVVDEWTPNQNRYSEIFYDLIDDLKYKFRKSVLNCSNVTCTDEKGHEANDEQQALEY